MLSQGKLDYPYVRQFANTTPYLYELRQMLLFDMGVPLALLGLAGIIWATTRVLRKLDNDWLVVVSWILVYFAIVGSAYTKFSRYMLPIMPPLVICGAAAIVALFAWGVRRIGLASADSTTRETASRPRWSPSSVPLFARISQRTNVSSWRSICVALALVVVLGSSFFTVALLNIYSAPNTRVQASEWIYNHVKPGAVFTNEVWDDPLPIEVPPAHRDAQGQWATPPQAMPSIQDNTRRLASTSTIRIRPTKPSSLPIV